MLSFNPVFRPSAQTLLKNPIFDKIRRPKIEQPSQFKVVCDFDDDYTVNDDYEEFRKELRQ